MVANKIEITESANMSGYRELTAGEIHPPGMVISVFSTLSGVGKTTLAVNLAVAIAEKTKKRICVIDLDFQFGDVARYLGLTADCTIGSSINKEVTSFRLIKCMHSWGENIDVYAVPPVISTVHTVSSKDTAGLLTELKEQYSFVMIDTATGFSEACLTALDMADTILLVGILETVAAVKNLKTGISTLDNLGYGPDKVKLMINRWKAKMPIDVSEAQKVLGYRFAAKLPNDFCSASSAISWGIPLVVQKPQSDLSAELLDVAEKLSLRILEEDPKKTKITTWLKGWLDGVKQAK